MPKQKPNEQVQQIPLSEIRPFKNHPFKVTDDELMQQTIDSIMQVGVLNPAIIRPAPEGGYEMVSPKHIFLPTYASAVDCMEK